MEKDGKCLLIEAYYSYGVMLLLLDRLIPAIARERMVVCYVRYKSATESELTTQVAKMCKSTGSFFSKTDNDSKTSFIPVKYPVDYFARFKVNK